MITFDPAQISYGQLLQIAFSVVHDPTQLNRQGPDCRLASIAPRSSIADADQRRIAESYIAQLNQAHAFPRPIATRIEPLKGFYPAEGYHQDYLVHHPDALVHRVQRFAEGRESRARLSGALQPAARAHDLEVASRSKSEACEQLRHQPLETSRIVLDRIGRDAGCRDRARPAARRI